MATGITTNTTVADINVKVVIPEITSGVVIPGVAPNTDLTLTTQDNISGITSNVIAQELATSTNTNPELTTSENIVATEVTLAKFVRGLDLLDLKNPVYKRAKKVLINTTSIIDIFNRKVSYVRSATETVGTTQNIYFLANKGTRDQTVTSDLLTRRIIFGRKYLDTINFIDVGIKYKLNTNYLDLAKFSESVTTKSTYSRNITGKEIAQILDLQINKRVSIPAIDTSNLLDGLSKKANAKLLQSVYSPDVYYNNVLKLLADNVNNTMVAVLTPRKVARETLTAQESNSRLWNIFRNLLETKTILETRQVRARLPKFDTIKITEALGKKQKIETYEFNRALDNFSRQATYRRTVKELLNVTDDYYGLANIDDDQYAGYYKQVRESVTFQERFKRAVTTLLINRANISDPFIRVVSYQRSFTSTGSAEAINNVEVNSKKSAIIKSSTTLNQDYYSRIANFYRQPNDISRLLEQKRFYIRNYVTPDITVITDTKALLLRSYLNTETITLATGDTRYTITSFNRIIADVLNATDDYYGLANIDDDQYAGFYKQVRDGLTFQNPNPVKNVTTTLAPSIARILDPYIALLTYNRAFTEIVNKFDSISKSPKLSKFDTVTNQDYFNKTTSFYRAVLETKTLSEQKQFFVAKYTAPDNINISDKSLLRVYRSLGSTEVITGTDTRSTITNFIRRFLDTVYVTDDYYGLSNVDDDQYVQVNKGVRDTISFAERVTPVSFTFYSPLTQTYTAQDQLTKFVRKYPNTSLMFAIEQKAVKVNKYANNEIFYSYDYPNRQTNKGLQDTINFTDLTVVTRLLRQQFLETLRPNANDVRLKPKKVIRDTLTSADYYNYRMNYGRKFIEILGMNTSSDRRYFRVGKGIRDTVNFTDSAIASKKFIQQFLETLQPNANDVRLKPKKVIRDTITSADYYNYRMNYGRKFIEILGMNTSSDRRYFRVGKGIRDTVNFTDTLQKVLAKYYFLYDTVRPTDDYYGLANVDDDQYARFNKKYNDVFTARDYFKYRASINRIDTFTKTDKTALKVTLPKLDSIHFTETFAYSKFSGYTRTLVDQIFKSDSGTINNQNYFASKYVEPGYAGTNRTIIGS